MTAAALHPIPAFAAVLAEQTRVVGLAVRREALLLAAILGVVGLLIVASFFSQTGGVEGVTGEPLPPVLMIAMGALAPFAIWKGERVFDGAHLWTLPVERRRHALSKVLAGGFWLLIVVTGFQLWLQGLALITGGELQQNETRLLIGPGGPGDLTPVQWTTPVWQWATPFTTVVICYIISSAFMLGVRHPLRWGTAAVAAFFLLGLLAEGDLVGLGFTDHLFALLTEGPFGIDPATGGGDSIETSELTGGRDVLGDPEIRVLWHQLPSFERWIPAVLAWAAFALSAFSVALFRHRER